MFAGLGVITMSFKSLAVPGFVSLSLKSALNKHMENTTIWCQFGKIIGIKWLDISKQATVSSHETDAKTDVSSVDPSSERKPVRNAGRNRSAFESVNLSTQFIPYSYCSTLPPLRHSTRISFLLGIHPLSILRNRSSLL